MKQYTECKKCKHDGLEIYGTYFSESFAKIVWRCESCGEKAAERYKFVGMEEERS